MPLAIQIPGLDGFIREIPDGHILLVEGGLDVAKSLFVQHLARTAAANDRTAHIVTSRSVEDLETALAQEAGRTGALTVRSATHLGDQVLEPSEGDLFVDSFSFLSLGLDETHLATTLQRLRSRCRETDGVAVLAVERGMLTPRCEAIVGHLADGIIQFHHREDNEGVIQYLRIPKWMTGEVFTRNIYYGFDGRRLLVDTRKRLV